ncbi:hypothetical protein UFOVP1519_3 [uncultured Caudovirales phage]|uniref:Uncharacterized protein n=1 Tax=uncultured Caudovirales phage TaxID=2100421 RepID=A0A6J5RLG4_9CAUD|nr:hypothetical protein UFOVP1306_60 [uncultured Caudovirales phage]CAB4210597.1 hypothetical protein UFOVP1422_62 [uncultured Caudovirales phage]CAB5227086.1 hypothetical protein UFOVP1519_3 [uncultured Caudovirales phage]
MYLPAAEAHNYLVRETTIAFRAAGYELSRARFSAAALAKYEVTRSKILAAQAATQAKKAGK